MPVRITLLARTCSLISGNASAKPFAVGPGLASEFETLIVNSTPPWLVRPVIKRSKSAEESTMPL